MKEGWLGLKQRGFVRPTHNELTSVYLLRYVVSQNDSKGNQWHAIL